MAPSNQSYMSVPSFFLSDSREAMISLKIFKSSSRSSCISLGSFGARFLASVLLWFSLNNDVSLLLGLRMETGSSSSSENDLLDRLKSLFGPPVEEDMMMEEWAVIVSCGPECGCRADLPRDCAFRPDAVTARPGFLVVRWHRGPNPPLNTSCRVISSTVPSDIRTGKI